MNVKKKKNHGNDMRISKYNEYEHENTIKRSKNQKIPGSRWLTTIETIKSRNKKNRDLDSRFGEFSGEILTVTIPV